MTAPKPTIPLTGIAFLLLLVCFSEPGVAQMEPASGKVGSLPEVFRTPDFPLDEIDSLALWRDGKGGGRLYITAKKVDEIHVCDAASGAKLASLGGPGKDLGQLARPNGIAVLEDLLFVVERDNHRVQIFEVPSHKPLLTFGEEQLELPYGLTLFKVGTDIALYITDDYPVPGMGPAKKKKKSVEGPKSNLAANLARLDQRVKRFLVRRQGSQLAAVYLGAFGDTTPEGALHAVESILADPLNGNLFICDETTRSVKIYSLEGQFKGMSLGQGLIQADPEGLALVEQAEALSGGYLIVTDQGPKCTLFRLFSRDGRKYYGAYTGEPVLANTDGITFSPGDLGPFKGGALYAVQDDLRVQGYSWESLGLSR